jgi:hypothetical protein
MGYLIRRTLSLQIGGWCKARPWGLFVLVEQEEALKRVVLEEEVQLDLRALQARGAWEPERWMRYDILGNSRDFGI